jgi:lipopolysaccharide biosynthesis regulator YciM
MRNPSEAQGDGMVSKPTPAWKMLSRMIDRLMAELSPDDLDDLHTRVQTERNRRFAAPLQNCGFHDHNLPCDCDLC